jgi:hypothetical protein
MIPALVYTRLAIVAVTGCTPVVPDPGERVDPAVGPQANAGNDQTAIGGDLVTLDGPVVST